MKHLFPGILLALTVLFGVYSCAPSEMTQEQDETSSTSTVTPLADASQPNPDPRVGLESGLFEYGEAIWNLELLSATPPPEEFLGSWGTDLAFKDNYAIQGNYDGFIVWDISDPANPTVAVDYKCPASQSDVSVYGNLLFVSGEGLGGRLDCGDQGVQEPVSEERLRGIRIFDISDIENPEYVSNVQTCRGSHTHSVLVDPDDNENVYVYVSGSAPVRPEEELPGCTTAFPNEDEDSALFRIEVIQVPLDNPQAAAIASSPRIFDDLEAPPTKEISAEERQRLEEAREAGAFIGKMQGQERVIPGGMVRNFLSQIVEERGGNEVTAEDSAALRDRLPEFIDEMLASRGRSSEALGPNQCHDITLYPELGLAGGACEGYGLLLDISDPVNPTRIDAVADSNFAYWHSATFNNDGTTVIFTDEWGGGTQPKCREEDPYEWGANAIYTIEDGEMVFQDYFKMDAPQTAAENCVAHNGSMIPVPGRDIMVQAWYQGGINIFDFTDPKNPVEMAFHDRGPINPERVETGGSWSVYWYNGVLVSSEIARGLDIFKILPSDFVTENEIAAANTVNLDYLNAQGQPKYTWPPSYELARAYADQLERGNELDNDSLQMVRRGIADAERANGTRKTQLLNALASELENKANDSSNGTKVTKLAQTLKELASAS